MKKIAAFITGLFLCAGLFAQSDEFKKFCRENAKSKMVRGDFELVQYNEKKKDTKRKSEGNFTLSVDDGIIWFTKKPVEVIQIMTDTKITQYVRGKKKVIDGKDNPTFLSIAKITASLFSGDYDEIEKNFEIECGYILNSVYNGKTEYDVVLTPKKDSAVSSYIKKIQLIICFEDMPQNDKDFKACYISELTIADAAGNVSSYILKNQRETDSLTGDEQKYFKE